MKTGPEPDWDHVKRVLKLSTEIIELVTSRKRDPQEVADALQAIVDAPSKPAPPHGLSRKRYKELVRYWDEHYPGKGAAIMDLLGPFYDPSLILRPASPDLEQRCRAALFLLATSCQRQDVHAAERSRPTTTPHPSG